MYVYNNIIFILLLTFFHYKVSNEMDGSDNFLSQPFFPF